MRAPENPLAGYGPTHHRGKAREIDHRLERVASLGDPFDDAVLCAPVNGMSTWQPIETAPLDGSNILLLAHGMVIEACYSPGSWSDSTPNGPAEYRGAVWVAFDDAVQFEIEEISDDPADWHHGPVTHWMPLPAPPVQA
jgi:hypothetical protein